MDEDSPHEQGDELSEFEVYGTTPPRTRRRHRERKQKDFTGSASQSKTVKTKKSLCRRNTCNSMFDELLAKADSSETDTAKRTDKRSMKLLRGSERDLKLDIASAQSVPRQDNISVLKTPQPSVQIESCKQFKSLCSKLIVCPKKLPQYQSLVASSEDENNYCQSRVEFHKTLSLLIRMGCGNKQAQERLNPRRAISKEEYLWQNELKDIIWLELQAYHADRTPAEEDNFLCLARESVPCLLNDIMKYSFSRHCKRNLSQNSDSGVEDDCSGCLSMYCHSCMEAQNDALKEVEELMKRLEAAESLFPSSRTFGELYPLYNSAEFVGRVKAMCLWYNITKHQRLSLVILGRLLALLENKYFQWPLQVTDSADGRSVESGSPSDSNSSSSSVGELYNKNNIDFYNVTPITYLVDKTKTSSTTTSPYRKYIENMLKTKGLSRSLNFLDKLHRHVLRKARLTLTNPGDFDVLNKKICCESPDEELQRYGIWSPESKALNLPSYKSSFLFLCTIPLQVVHEFLLMRLEQKPVNPSPLSTRQLIRELKEGIKIATLQKARCKEYLDVIFPFCNESRESCEERIDAFDGSLYKVFCDYLEYLEQWALLQHDNFQKSLLEEEYNFCREVVDYIPKAPEMLCKKFCSILTSIMYGVGTRLIDRIDDLAKDMLKDDELSIKQNLFLMCRDLQSILNEEREMAIKTMSFCKAIFKSKPVQDFAELGKAIVTLKCTIARAIDRIQKLCDCSYSTELDDSEKASLMLRTREVLMQGYRFGFEFYKEMSEYVLEEDQRIKLARSMVHFAHLWMTFVRERCDKGRGMRPRWAYQGLEFLLTVCEPQNTKFLTDEEFEELKRDMDSCISHVIGTTVPSTPDSGFFSASPRASLDHMRSFQARSRGSSPSPRPTYRSQRSNASSRKTSMEKSPLNDSVDAPSFNNKTLSESVVKMKLQPAPYSDRVKDAVQHLDQEIDELYRKQRLIGTVISPADGTLNKSHHIRRKYVTFTWQRGIKIGQGRFGKVYTAVNNSTGEMMAVKEIALQHNDSRTISKVAEELKILEGITHRNLVRYYGIELHREEMLIFMEFCAEGTLESLILGTEHGLPELIMRKYTYQLLSGLAVLHDHGIVHRDIKTANIFLTDEGNYLKIGDFGCAAKLKSHTTMPGELKGFVGTQAYMAPEVFTRSMNEGHGRAADIWSVGCVVVEMATGKRPWHQYDSNFQIMFKVGMGLSPDPPEDMIDEGLEFLDRCFQHDPSGRATAVELLDHNFVKIGHDLIKY